jgi:hypothetical protein
MSLHDFLIVICVYGIPLGIFVWYKFFRTEKEYPPLDFVQAMSIIERLNLNQNRLKSIEDLLTSSQLCDDEHEQNIKCVWSSAENKEGYTFTLNETANHFTDMAVEEREKLRSEIVSDIDLLCDLRRNGITETVTQREEEPPDSEEIKTEGECEDEPVEAVPRQWI